MLGRAVSEMNSKATAVSNFKYLEMRHFKYKGKRLYVSWPRGTVSSSSSSGKCRAGPTLGVVGTRGSNVGVVGVIEVGWWGGVVGVVGVVDVVGVVGVVGVIGVGQTSMSVLFTVRGWERVVASFSSFAFPLLFSSGSWGEEDADEEALERVVASFSSFAFPLLFSSGGWGEEDADEEALFWMVIDFFDNTASMEVCLLFCFRLWRLRLILGRAKMALLLLVVVAVGRLDCLGVTFLMMSP